MRKHAPRFAVPVGAIALAGLLFAVGAGLAADRPYLDIRVFTKVGQPGQPEPIAIGPDRRVYVGTNQLGHGDTDAPSRVFAYNLRGRLVRQYVMKGQPLAENHGIQGLAFDRDGLLYALDRSANPRVVVFDPATGGQRVYSRFRDVPPCNGPSTGNCSQTILDMPAGPDYAAFGPGGALYVTDIDQALIWKIPKGGGRPSIWLTDPRFESLYGPNGIQFKRDGRTILFVNTASNPNAGNTLTGRIYQVRIGRGGAPVDLKQVWESRPVDAPDGLAIARSGRIYVALAGTSQVAGPLTAVSPRSRGSRRARLKTSRRRSRSTGRAAPPSSVATCSSPTTRRSPATLRAGRSSTSAPASGACRSSGRGSSRRACG